MTDEERKAWDEEVMVWARACSFPPDGYPPHGLATLILAADAELKRLREIADELLQWYIPVEEDHPMRDIWGKLAELRRRAGKEG